MPHHHPSGFERDIYSVTRLNREVRAVLEGSFPLLWVEGELSNLARPASGHLYFSLKDPQSQVRCALFRMKRQHLRFEPNNGDRVLIRARVGLYKGRGEFQLIVEHMEAAGEGALRQAFEALKQRLAAEGLFDSARKRPLPAHPARVGIITSPSGAALRDVLTVLRRRHAGIGAVIYPVAVQGAEAPAQIARMIGIADLRHECDLLILTRGGGSLEDLMAFNDEEVARAIAACHLPLISAVGHEIDFTIADFTADQRAATPSAAAELVSPDATVLTSRLTALHNRLRLQLRQRLERTGSALHHARARLHRLHPGLRLAQQQQRLDELEQRLVRDQQRRQNQQRQHLLGLTARLHSHSPGARIVHWEQRRLALIHRLRRALQARRQGANQRLAASAARLHALSPLATLARGYSITFSRCDGRILTDSTGLAAGDEIETRLARGRLISRVERCLGDEDA
ncbi:MAG: exodeoxyribonuclease VII large subunit [gamma proteobacterium symbiont of Phacoides pectinatus]